MLDQWTEQMILKKIRTGGKAILNFTTFQQTFSSPTDFMQFCRKHRLSYRYGRECVILTWKERIR